MRNVSENNQTYGDRLSTAWIQADEQVRRIRNEVTRAMQDAHRKAAQPSLRAEAEAELKATLKSLDSPINEARRSYEVAQQEHFMRSMETKQYQTRNLTGQALPEAICQERARAELASARAESLRAFSAAAQAASRPETPFATGVTRSLRERLPEQAESIMNTPAGKLTVDASVEQALVLTPNEPVAWNPKGAEDVSRAKQYLQSQLRLTDLDRGTKQNQVAVSGHRGAGLAVESYAAMTTEQRGIAQAWASTSRVQREAVDSRQKLNSAAAETYAAENGLPSMPAVDPSTTDAGAVQKTMLKEAHSHSQRTGAVPIYGPSAVSRSETAVGMDR